MKVQNKDGKGNPWHSDATGEFTSPGGDGSKKIDAESPSKWSDPDKEELTEDDLWKELFEDNDTIEQEPVEPLEEVQEEEIKEEDGDIEDRTSEAYKKKNKILKKKTLNSLLKATRLETKTDNFKLFEKHFNKWDLSNDFLEATIRIFEEYNLDFILNSGNKSHGATELYIGLAEYSEDSVDDYRHKNTFIHEMAHCFDHNFRSGDYDEPWDYGSEYVSSYFYDFTLDMSLSDAINEEFDNGKYTSNTPESKEAREALNQDMTNIMNAYSNYVDTNSVEYTSNLPNKDSKKTMKEVIDGLDKMTEGRFTQLRKSIDEKYESQIKNIRSSLTNDVDAETYLKNLNDLNNLVADKAMYCNSEFNKFIQNEKQKIDIVPDYDFKNEFRNKIERYISRFRNETIFKTFRIDRGMVEMAPVTDVFKGANNGEEITGYGLIHPTDYYKKNKALTHIECVAGMVAAIEENTPTTIGLLKKYFPKTFTIVKEILEKEFYKKGDKNEKK